jgi:hypothetical protein
MGEDSKQEIQVKKIGLLSSTKDNADANPNNSVWGMASWIIQWETKEKNTLNGFPAYFSRYNHPFRPWMGYFSNNVTAGLTGASKLVVEPGQLIEYTEAWGYRTKRNLDLDAIDSIDVVHLPNQYWLLLGWIFSVTLWGGIIGIPMAIRSFWKKHVFFIIYFGMKSTTNIPVIIRIEGDDWRERISQFRTVLNQHRK